MTVTHTLKQNIVEAPFKQWQVAKKIGINETTLIVWLRDEASLDTDRKNRVLKAIQELSHE